MVRRFLTYEMPDIEVRVRSDGHKGIVRTDEEGYFRVRVPGPHESGWLRFTVEADRAAATVAEVLVPPASSRLLVISDIDDTILPTGATRTATVVRTTLLGNARTREPFPGMADFYQALVGGASGDEANPVFYVSSSPWNLYDFMVDFMAMHGLPAGPISLRDLGVDRHRFIHGRHEDHKLVEIRTIFGAYPDLSAVLVGDIGQHDPEIYGTIASEYPGRICAVYLRDVGAGRDQEQRALAITDRTGVPVVLAAHTSEFQIHAAGIGLIAGLP
jgi:phosphatidate phosphatase APP1